VTVHDDYWTLTEAAAHLKMSKMTLGRLIRRGQIPAIKLGHSWRISRRCIEALFWEMPLSVEAQKALVQVMPLQGNGHAG
jgi:excisionase family DNA binding protein